MKFLSFVVVACVLACGLASQSPATEQPPKASTPTDETDREGTLDAIRDLLGGYHIGVQDMLSTSRQAFEIADAAIARARVTADPDEAAKFLDLAKRAGVIGAALSAQVRKARDAIDAIEEAKVDLKRRVIDQKAALKVALEQSGPLRSLTEDQSMTTELTAIGDRVGRPLRPLIEVRR